MIRVAIADDEPLARRGMLARLAAESDVTVVAEAVDGHGVAALRRTVVDLAIVDVQMPGLNGIDALSAIPFAERPLAILLTAHDRFAVQAFALGAVDYLLKPMDEERFAESVERARRRLGHTLPAAMPAERFAIRVGARVHYVSAADVEWIEADGDYVVLHARGHRHLLRETLHTLSQRLDPALFLRVHRSAIVRVDRVAELRSRPNRDAVLRLRGGEAVRVSRTYIDALMAMLPP